MFGVPTGFGGRVRSVVGWSRVLDRREVLCAINTDPAQERTAWVTVDAELQRRGSRWRCCTAAHPGRPAR